MSEYREVSNWQNDTPHATRCCGAQGQACVCGSDLECLDDYIGGGSHYWYLRCPVCTKEWTYDTYGFELRELMP